MKSFNKSPDDFTNSRRSNSNNVHLHRKPTKRFNAIKGTQQATFIFQRILISWEIPVGTYPHALRGLFQSKKNRYKRSTAEVTWKEKRTKERSLARKNKTIDKPKKREKKERISKNSKSILACQEREYQSHRRNKMERKPCKEEKIETRKARHPYKEKKIIHKRRDKENRRTKKEESSYYSDKNGNKRPKGGIKRKKTARGNGQRNGKDIRARENREGYK